MKKTSKKLNLNRETVRNLDAASLGGVAGGRRVSRNGSCVTQYNCPSVQFCPSLDVCPTETQ